MKLILFILYTFFSLSVYGQTKSYDSLKTLVQQKLIYLDSYNYFEPQFEDVDIDSIAQLTAKNVVKLLTYKNSLELKDNPLKNLDLTTSYNDSIIRIYNFFYSSGGTRGSVSHPIIQWKKSNGEYGAYNLSKKINSSFGYISRLKAKDKTLFILLGAEKGNASNNVFTAYVIQIKNDYLILDYPALFNRPYLIFTNVELDFNFQNQTLKITSVEDVTEDIILHTRIENEKTKDNIIECFNEDAVCELRFDGYKFIKK